MSKNVLVVEIDAISDLALEIMQAILARNEEAQAITEDESGPLALARALSDFFQISGGIESGSLHLEQDELDELTAYGLDLLDRLAFLVRKIEIMDKRDTVARMFASMGVWAARRGATIDNLEGTADPVAAPSSWQVLGPTQWGTGATQAFNQATQDSARRYRVRVSIP